ncbi:MAG: TatD family hydrolase [Cytophagales bacterium]|nr:TatD family hydrolase [Cytophagales bacterium]
MTNMIDTHAHIYLNDFEQDINEVIRDAKEAGIAKIFMPNIDSRSIERMLTLEDKFPNYCVPMMGLHPCYVKENYKAELHAVESWLEKRKFCAIGEAGIDLYWDKTHISAQIEALEVQIDWAKNLDLPLVLHCRNSMDMTMEIIEKHQDGKLKGIFHCFTGNPDQAGRIIDMNFTLGIGGVVTFKNGGLDKVIPHVDLKNIVLETDSPYLAPVPYRGKRNTPAYLSYIVNRISELKSCGSEEVTHQTTENALALF